MENRAGKENAALAAAFVLILIVFSLGLAISPAAGRLAPGSAVEAGAVTAGE